MEQVTNPHQTDFFFSRDGVRLPGSDDGLGGSRNRVAVHAARIMTIGERAEDVFSISDFDGRPLAPEACDELRDRLESELNRSE